MNKKRRQAKRKQHLQNKDPRSNKVTFSQVAEQHFGVLDCSRTGTARKKYNAKVAKYLKGAK